MAYSQLCLDLQAVRSLSQQWGLRSWRLCPQLELARHMHWCCDWEGGQRNLSGFTAEAGIQQTDLAAGKRQKLMTVALSYEVQGWFAEWLIWCLVSAVQELVSWPGGDRGQGLPVWAPAVAADIHTSFLSFPGCGAEHVCLCKENILCSCFRTAVNYTMMCSARGEGAWKWWWVYCLFQGPWRGTRLYLCLIILPTVIFLSAASARIFLSKNCKGET